MYRFLFIFILCVFSFLNLPGKKSHYSFTQLSIGEGLLQASVDAILMDQKGDLWIGTKNGLNRYSQQKMENFFHQADDKHSLPDNRVLHLAEDSLGNIWVSTLQGLAKYDREEKQFHIYTQGRVESSLCIEGGILFGGDNVLYFYNYETQELEERIHIQPEDPNTPSIQYRVLNIIPLDKERALIGTRRKGIFIYHFKTEKFETFTADVPLSLLFSLCRTSDERVYASFYGEGVRCYDKNGKRIANYLAGESALNNNYVMDITEHQGQVWLATDGGGINLIDMQSGAFSYLQHQTGDLSTLPFNSITVLYKDPNRNLWLGSVRGGAIHVKESHIRTYQDVVMNHNGGLTDKSITSLYEEENGQLWIGTDGGGVNLYNPETDKFTHYPSTYGDKVVAIAGLNENELLISLYTKGFFKFNKKSGKYQPFIVMNKAINQRVCFNGYIPLAHRIGPNKIYIIGYEGWVYRPNEHKFTPLVMPEKHRKLTSALQVAYSNKDFTLLKQGSYAFMIDQKTDSVTYLTETLPDESIMTMTYDETDQTVWIGTNRGLRLYDMKKQEYKTFESALFGHISFLTIDHNRRLWISAHNKLFSYSIAEDKFVSWNTSDGYLPNEILSKYPTTSNKEYIYLCGTQGLVKIDASIQASEDDEPSIYLAEMYYNGELYTRQAKEGELQIPWDYHSIVLTFGVKCKDVFQKHLLRYTIEGETSSHTFESFDPTLNLPSLSPGRYTLKVASYTKDGQETLPMPMLTLTITPPWYKTTWFISLLVLLVVSTTAGIAYWYHRRKTLQMKGDVGEFLQTVLHSLSEKDELIEEASTEQETPTPALELSEADKAFLAKMDKLIHDNLSNDELSAKFLTDHLAMSRASLYNKVKALTGLGVNDYINRIRIERSVHLLTTTDLSINEISYEVGFSYPRYFSTSFKQMKGMTPTKFKEESKRKTKESR